MNIGWHDVAAILGRVSVPDGYTLEHLDPARVAILVARLRDWYPDIVVGSECCHLSERFYVERTFLRGAVEDRAVLPIILTAAGEVVGLVTLERNDDARTIQSRMGAIAPPHRGRKLALLGPTILETVGRVIGSELAYYFATLKIPQQQLAAEACGFSPVGIVPGFDRDMVAPGTIRRVPEVLYAKLLVTEDVLFVPALESLTPRTRALWDVVIGRK